jgi:hypothetical protein
LVQFIGFACGLLLRVALVFWEELQIPFRFWSVTMKAYKPPVVNKFGVISSTYHEELLKSIFESSNRRKSQKPK